MLSEGRRTAVSFVITPDFDFLLYECKILRIIVQHYLAFSVFIINTKNMGK